jgi:DNA-directed RNA polymerase sigma subunit (sigma70/sigma32)
MAINYERDTKRDKEILRMREKLKMTFADISVPLGISRARVRQLYNRLVAERNREKEVV